MITGCAVNYQKMNYQKMNYQKMNYQKLDSLKRSALSSGTGEQMPLFSAVEPEVGKRQIAVNPRNLAVNPHLQAARRLSRKIRRLPDHSLEQTQAGLAIFQHLRALLRDTPEQPPPH